MTIALRLMTLATLAALTGWGAPASASLEAAHESPSLSEPDVAWDARVDYEEWQPPLPPGQDGWPTEPPSRWPELRASMLLLAEVRPGENLDYVVVLRNISDHPVDLRPCGGYRQEVRDLGAGLASEPVDGGSSSFRLNCDAHPFLLPGESRRYAMRLTVPAALSGEEALFVWGFVDNMPDYDAQQWVPVAVGAGGGPCGH